MIRVRGALKKYSSQCVIGPLTIDLEPGGVTALVGPNGAGKSTLLGMIGRLVAMDGGTIEVAGLDVARAATRELAQVLSVLRQENHFLTRLTVRQLVGFGRFPFSQGRLNVEDQRHIDEAIEFLGLEDLEDRYIDELSGGQRQRAYVAMVLAQNTDYLLLDEPLNNLDISHSVVMMKQLKKVATKLGRTVIIVLHDINFALRYSDRVVAMKDGQIVFSSTPQEALVSTKLSDVFATDIRVVASGDNVLVDYF